MDMDADIEVMLGDFGVPMTFGAYTGKCLVDLADQEMVPTITGALVEVRIGTIRTAAFPGLAVGSTVVVDGTTYTVRDRKRVGDGRLTIIALGAA
jgi:hypothetical protein